jgi:N-acetylmuramoyl-L-alanine amidase
VTPPASRLGDTGPAVAEIRDRLGRLGILRRLSSLGFHLGRVDGVFGALTDGALREFQRSVGVDADGTCGPETFRAMARLARTMSGGGVSSILREMQALDTLCSGVADKVVVLDPGHGTSDPGVVQDDLSENAIAGDLATRIEGRLAAIGVQVLLTRSPDGDGSSDEADRAAFANHNGADLVVSPLAAGCATYYFGDTVAGYGSALGARMAEMLQTEVTARTDLTDLRTHAKSWDLLRMTRMPAVRVECGYISSPHDASRLADPAFRDAVAEGIAAAVVRFFAPVPSELVLEPAVVVPA